MRYTIALLLLLLAVHGWAAQTIDITAVNIDMPVIALTSSEDTCTLTVQSNGARLFQFQADQNWAISNSTMAFANKTFVPANQIYTVLIPSDAPTTGVVFYIQAQSTSCTLKGRSVARSK